MVDVGSSKKEQMKDSCIPELAGLADHGVAVCIHAVGILGSSQNITNLGNLSLRNRKQQIFCEVLEAQRKLLGASHGLNKSAPCDVYKSAPLPCFAGRYNGL